MDLVYISGESLWGSNELRYSLRSAEKYLSFDKVFIIGYLPSFISKYKVIHIPFKERPNDKWHNVEKKFDLLVDIPEISDDFILMNDDFWVFKKYKKVPYLYNRKLKEMTNFPVETPYLKRIKKTLEMFPDAKNFEVHFPIVFNKKKLKRLFDKYGSKGYERRSAYCAEYKIKGIPSDDYKVFRIKDLDKFQGKPFISTIDRVAIDPKFQEFLEKSFPDKSFYEIDSQDKRKLTKEELIKTIQIYKRTKPDKYLKKKKELEYKLQLLNDR